MTNTDGLTSDEPGLPRPWEQQPHESDRAYYLFCLYRDLHPLERSASRVRSDLMESEGKRRSLRWIEDYRSRFAWVERVRAWDGHQDEKRRREMIQESIDMGRRQATDARALSMAMMIPVRELLRRMTDIFDAEQLKRLSLGDLLVLSVQTGRVLPAAMHAERLARGAPTPDYGVFDVETAEAVAAPSVFDTESHLAEVWMAMEEAGIRPRQRELESPSDPDGSENGHA